MKKERTDYFLELPLLLYRPIRWGKTRGSYQLKSKTIEAVKKESIKRFEDNKRDSFKMIDKFEDLSEVEKQSLKDKFPEEITVVEVTKYTFSIKNKTTHEFS